MTELPPPDPGDEVARPQLDGDHVIEPVSPEEAEASSDPGPLIRDANGRLWRSRPATTSAWLRSLADRFGRLLSRLLGGS